MIDTHCHLYLDEFDEDRAEVVRRAREAGVSHLLLPNIDASSIDAMVRMETDFPDVAYAMMGLHPCSVDAVVNDQLQEVARQLARRQFIGVGEIGTDLYWDQTFVKQQEDAFRTQLMWSGEYRLPVAIHSRDSLDLNIRIVRELQDGSLTGVFHCFNGTVSQGKEIIELGFYLGIGGVVTFRNAGVDKVIAELPLESMVLETDAPYLTPVPFRGKRNESAYLSYVVQKVAELHGMPVDEVVAMTDTNAKTLFPGAFL